MATRDEARQAAQLLANEQGKSAWVVTSTSTWAWLNPDNRYNAARSLERFDCPVERVDPETAPLVFPKRRSGEEGEQFAALPRKPGRPSMYLAPEYCTVCGQGREAHHGGQCPVAVATHRHAADTTLWSGSSCHENAVCRQRMGRLVLCGLPGRGPVMGIAHPLHAILTVVAMACALGFGTVVLALVTAMWINEPKGGQ